MDDLKWLTTLGVVFGPALIMSGIMYPINSRKKAKRILQVESEAVNEAIQFVGDRTFLGVIDTLTFALGFVLGMFLHYELNLSKGSDLLMRLFFLPYLLWFLYAYYKTPLVIFTLHKVYLFPWYGFSSVPQSYDLDVLQWREEYGGKGGERICVYAGAKFVFDTRWMSKGDDFVREHVKPKEA